MDSPRIPSSTREIDTSFWGPCGLSGMRMLQRSKIAEIRTALAAAGIRTLDAQAEALGLSRSTTWSLLNPAHKGSGLSPRLIRRMWQSPRLPRSVQQKLCEYVEQKLAGCYGHNERQRHEFAACLMRIVKR